MTRIGTSHFVSLEDAIAYYQPYEYPIATEAVMDKIAKGEIHVGPPELKPGQLLCKIDCGHRYAIEE